MNRVKFHDAELTERLKIDGYATFDLLNNDEVNALKSIFFENHLSNPEGFYATTHLEDKEKRKILSDKAMSILSSRIESNFQNRPAVYGSPPAG